MAKEEVVRAREVHQNRAVQETWMIQAIGIVNLAPLPMSNHQLFVKFVNDPGESRMLMMLALHRGNFEVVYWVLAGTRIFLTAVVEERW